MLLVIVSAAAGAGGGYWYAARQAAMVGPPLSAESAAAADRPILYYRDPSGAPFWSAEPKKDSKGQDYVPVYDDQESSPGERGPKRPSSAAASKKILYYRNPMGLPDTSPVAKKDSMGMDYIPVYEGEDQDEGNTIKVSLDRIQRSGVRTEKVQLRTVVRPIRAPGTVRIDERKLAVVTLRAEGYIEELHVNATGETVKAGEPLFRLYSPLLVQAQLEYALAVKTARNMNDANQTAMVDGAAL